MPDFANFGLFETRLIEKLRAKVKSSGRLRK